MTQPEVNISAEGLIENLHGEYLAQIKDLQTKLAYAKTVNASLAQELTYWRDKANADTKSNQTLSEKKKRIEDTDE